jgi:hypothetical protein
MTMESIAIETPADQAMSCRAQLLRLLRENFAALPMPPHLRSVPVVEPEAMAAWALAALRDCAWRPASTPPAGRPGAPHFPIAVLALVDDPRFRMNGDEPFVDVASWWPAEGKWTVTHCVRSEEGADDHEVKVRAWQPLREVPPPWSELWA